MLNAPIPTVPLPPAQPIQVPAHLVSPDPETSRQVQRIQELIHHPELLVGRVLAGSMSIGPICILYDEDDLNVGDGDSYIPGKQSRKGLALTLRPPFKKKETPLHLSRRRICT